MFAARPRKNMAKREEEEGRKESSSVYCSLHNFFLFFHFFFYCFFARVAQPAFCRRRRALSSQGCREINSVWLSFVREDSRGPFDARDRERDAIQSSSRSFDSAHVGGRDSLGNKRPERDRRVGGA